MSKRQNLFAYLVIFVETTFGIILSSPQDLEVNYKPTYEGYDASENRHLPIVEVFASNQLERD